MTSTKTLMEEQIKAAKHSFAAKEYQQAKEIILEIIDTNKYPKNYILYLKLADCCIELQEYENAQKYYQHSINENPTNANTFNKFGILLHHYLNNTIEAKSMYDKCLRLDPNHDQCLFNYAKLMENVSNYSKAEQLYLHCLKISEKACVHYHLAKLWLKQQRRTTNNDNKHHYNIEYLLQKATELQPQIAKYHYELAMYLHKIGKVNEANNSYQTALKLTQNKDSQILNAYNEFLKEYKQQQNGISMDKSIKMVVYEFESIITYWNLSKSVNNNIEEFNTMRTRDLVNIFGGYGRIERLQSHFHAISLQNICIVIISYTNSELIMKALKRVKLYQYFNDIITINKSKIDTIIKLKTEQNIFRSNQILCIDHKSQNNNMLKEYLKFFANKAATKPFIGLTPDDLDHIECIIRNQKYQPPLKPKKSKSLTTINEQLYNGIVREIVGNYRNYGAHKPIDTLPSMKYAKSNINKGYQGFIHFGYKFAIVVQKEKRDEGWICGHILKDLLLYEPNEAGLWRRYAKALSHLRHDKDAEYAYSKSFEFDPKNYKTSLSFSNHLLMTKEYKKAFKWFKTTMNLSRYKDNWSVCIGLARCLQELDRAKEAEYYYKLGVAQNNKAGNTQFYETAHFYYGQFLAKYNRLEEARDQYDICVQNTPNKALNHYRLAEVLYKLKDFEGYEYHLNAALKIDPYSHHLAKQDYENYYERKYEENEVNVNDGVNLNKNHMNNCGDTDIVCGDKYKIFENKFKSWLMEQNLLETFGDIFLKNNIYNFQSLKETANKKVFHKPIDKNVITHAAELCESMSQQI